MAFYEPIDMGAVQFAKKLFRNPIIKHDKIDNAVKNGDNYIIEDVEVMGYTEKDVKTDKGYEDRGAVFFKVDNGLIQIGISYYPPLRFSIPKSHLVSYETDEIAILQKIEITEWAYHNCYVLSINKIYENWGKMIRAHYNAYNNKDKSWGEAPMWKYSPYRSIIEQIKKSEIRCAIHEYKKRNKANNMVNRKGNKYNNKQGSSKASLPPKAELGIQAINSANNHDNVESEKDNTKIFYTDGAGNIANGEKYKDSGHYSVYLVGDPPEKWKKEEPFITSNEAEIKGVLSALYLAIRRGYDSVEIRTDSQNVVKWTLGRDIKLDTNIKKISMNIWRTKKPEIAVLIDKLTELASKIRNLKINYIPREVNYAHAV